MQENSALPIALCRVIIGFCKARANLPKAAFCYGALRQSRALTNSRLLIFQTRGENVRKKINGPQSGDSRTENAGKIEKRQIRTPTIDLLAMWYDMQVIRRFEERCGQITPWVKLAAFVIFISGKKRWLSACRPLPSEGDQVITGYRDHAHMLACGMEPKYVMAELTGRRDGYSKGKGGSMHMFSVEKNFYGGHGIVGAQVPIGTGLAFANRYRDNGNVSFVYFGDGAANQGQVYESFNMAELWLLPCVYIIENNRYAMGTSIERASAQTNLSQRGQSFSIPGEQVDGMDVEAVYEAGSRAAQWVRDGKGPYILEMLTYRYRGHSMSDPAKYRKREEVNKVREETDPIMLAQNRLIEARAER